MWRGVGARVAAKKRRPRERVRVQESAHGRELIIDETFASFYRPGVAATGSVWDAIAAPLLALPPRRRRRILLLGLGGGSAARIVRALAPDALIVGVELDAEVVEAARQHFDLDELEVEVIVDDALAVLERERRRFDVVLEDVFIGRGDDVHKPDWIPCPGHELALGLVAPGGLLVSNTIDESHFVAAFLREHFPSLVCVEVDGYDNRILVAGPAELDAGVLRRAVAADPVLRGSLEQLHFRSWTRRSQARSF
jgi:SAM-dependent methyltransferase